MSPTANEPGDGTTSPALASLSDTRQDRVEDLAWMADTGETVPGAAARLHLNPSTVRQLLADAGRRDVYARLLANQDDRTYHGPQGTITARTRRAA